MGTTNKVIAYVQTHYDGALINIVDEQIDARALNAFCVYVPDVGRLWLHLSWNPQTLRSVVTINLPAQAVRSNAA